MRKYTCKVCYESEKIIEVFASSNEEAENLAKLRAGNMLIEPYFSEFKQICDYNEKNITREELIDELAKNLLEGIDSNNIIIKSCIELIKNTKKINDSMNSILYGIQADNKL